jgi:apolipoprotein D and lipocalin family protein
VPIQRIGFSIGRVRVQFERVTVVMLLLMTGACTDVPPGIQPVRPFDISRYLGEWYEIARLDHSFERGLTNVTAIYASRTDGSVKVVNRGFDHKNCRWKDAEGKAVFQGARDTASLSVTFFWPFAGGYHVFALDRQDYGWAMVAGPSRSYLWILARRPDFPPHIRDGLVTQAKALGFPVNDLVLVDHSRPTCALAR